MLSWITPRMAAQRWTCWPPRPATISRAFSSVSPSHALASRPTGPALDLLAASPRHHFQGLFLREPLPYAGAVVVAFLERLHDLRAAPEGVEAGVTAEVVAGDPAEERIVLTDQVDEDLPEGAHGGGRPEVVLVFGNDIGESENQRACALPGGLGRRQEARGGEAGPAGPRGRRRTARRLSHSRSGPQQGKRGHDETPHQRVIDHHSSCAGKRRRCREAGSNPHELGT